MEEGTNTIIRPSEERVVLDVVGLGREERFFGFPGDVGGGRKLLVDELHKGCSVGLGGSGSGDVIVGDEPGPDGGDGKGSEDGGYRGGVGPAYEVDQFLPWSLVSLLASDDLVADEPVAQVGL